MCSLNTRTIDVSEVGILSQFPTEQSIKQVIDFFLHVIYYFDLLISCFLKNTIMLKKKPLYKF